jgi:UDP-N-acetyl-D-mannosaminuronate dehydrogenase
MQFEKDIETLEDAKETNHPLAKLSELLDRWNQEEVMTNDDLVKFARELWMTVEEFEKDLKESLKGHEIILSMKEHKF